MPRFLSGWNTTVVPIMLITVFFNRATRNKRDKDREKELFDVSFGEVQASTDMFPCPRCGRRDCR
jgi:hypothetical protein